MERAVWARVLCICSAEIAIKHEKNRVSEHPQVRPPVETLARGVKITQLIISHAREQKYKRSSQGRPWQSWWSHGNVAVARVSCMSMRRCAPDSGHSSISKPGGGSVGNVAVARVWRTSQTAHAIKHEEKYTSPSGTWQGYGECGCGSSFVPIEGLRGGRSSD